MKIRFRYNSWRCILGISFPSINTWETHIHLLVVDIVLSPKLPDLDWRHL